MVKVVREIKEYIASLNGFYEKKYVTVKVLTINSLSKNLFLVKTRLLSKLPKPEPPQFTMVWIPGYEAIPLSISYYSGNELWYIVKPVGTTTSKLVSQDNNIKYLGVYGPLGKPLIPVNGTKYLFIAGGSGLAPILYYLQKLCLDSRKYCEVVYGAWSYDEIGLVPKYITTLGGKPITTCLDKECEVNGVATDYLQHIDPGYFDYIIVCGPYKMIIDITRKLKPKHYDKTIVILESMVRCGIGLCGSCKIFPRSEKHLCIDGPAFYLSTIIKYLREASN